ncbi:ADP-ribose pyrophosphatase [Marinactinospora thermotolerans DSM 45154]|uniref:ADP-ribose pyrophosphatase n=1 Tax=Marinactinospora thermotolerans DSM 45154 TaxID=1122192 RepID=A0A1T4KPE1_9ACTN|nr:ADP-ribose pyrophosphatase [Marinactinospora thermotolerans DSM 45154]
MAEWSEEIADRPQTWEVRDSVERYRGAKAGMRTDWVVMPGENGSETVARDYLDHPGAVVVLAMDDKGRVLLLRQYRHPVGHYLWELPAGLRDMDGESPLRTAQRELLEETGHRAEAWYELAEVFPSTGFSNEKIVVYLAREISEVPPSEIDFVRVHEEADMPLAWVPLEEAVRAVLEGRLHNAATVVGILAAHAAAREGFAALRPARD